MNIDKMLAKIVAEVLADAIMEILMEQKFIKFLCQNNAYREFMHNLAYIEDGMYSWDEYAYTTPHEEWIAAAFTWAISLEGHEFWSDLNEKWEYLLKV